VFHTVIMRVTRNIDGDVTFFGTCPCYGLCAPAYMNKLMWKPVNCLRYCRMW